MLEIVIPVGRPPKNGHVWAAVVAGRIVSRHPTYESARRAGLHHALSGRTLGRWSCRDLLGVML